MTGFIRLALVMMVIRVLIPTPSAATLEVLDGGVEMRRTNTVQWLPVTTEGILAAGDSIRTDENGRARVVFFNDGTETLLEPNTEITLAEFQSDAQDFAIITTLHSGQTLHRLRRQLGADSRYDVTTGTTILGARGTVFAARQRLNGQLAVITLENTVHVAAPNNQTELVGAGFGARVEPDLTLSDVVRARTFAELDAALEGCEASAQIQRNRMMPVYTAPNSDATGIGAADPYALNRVYGVTESGAWFRITFNGGYGWVAVTPPIRGMTIADDCAGVRLFPNDFQADVSRYTEAADTELWRICVGEFQPPADWTTYTVREGESVYQIALEYGTTEAILVRTNCLADPRYIIAEETFQVPPR